jgi:hypothetical protein
MIDPNDPDEVARRIHHEARRQYAFETMYRPDLAKAFPDVNFRTSRSERRSKSVEVCWTDGPTVAAVKAALPADSPGRFRRETSHLTLATVMVTHWLRHHPLVAVPPADGTTPKVRRTPRNSELTGASYGDAHPDIQRVAGLILDLGHFGRAWAGAHFYDQGARNRATFSLFKDLAEFGDAAVTAAGLDVLDLATKI